MPRRAAPRRTPPAAAAARSLAPAAPTALTLRSALPQELLPALRTKIDEMAAGWSREEKDACLDQTANSFRYSGGLLSYLRDPNAGK